MYVVISVLLVTTPSSRQIRLLTGMQISTRHGPPGALKNAVKNVRPRVSGRVESCWEVAGCHTPLHSVVSSRSCSLGLSSVQHTTEGSLFPSCLLYLYSSPHRPENSLPSLVASFLKEEGISAGGDVHVLPEKKKDR